MTRVVYIWTTIYHEFEKEFYYQKINTEQFFNANLESPDYDTDTYFVPKHRKYCLANFLHTVLNKKERLGRHRRLFFDYRPNNALKQELGRHYRLSNKKIFETYISKKAIERRKVVQYDKNLHYDPRTAVIYTKPSLYYNMIIGKHYACAFQMVNHVPGEGVLTRPDLLATAIR